MPTILWAAVGFADVEGAAWSAWPFPTHAQTLGSLHTLTTAKHSV